MTKARRNAIAKKFETQCVVKVGDCIIYKDWSYARGTEYSLRDAKDGHTIDVDFRLDNLLDLL